jgi:6-phosphogluconolactonase (cycloisomerase 2 family)
MSLSGWKFAAALLLVAGAQTLTGCNGFFVYPGSTSTNTTTSSTDYVFSSNCSSTSTYICAYTLSNGTLTAASGSPLAVSYTPQSMVVSINDQYLFVSSGQGIYSYSIGTGGSLSAVSSLADTVQSLAVSPDGQWLLGVESASGASATYIDEFSMSSGTLTATAYSHIAVSASSGTTISYSEGAETIEVAPTGAYVALALGKGGIAVVPFTTSNGSFGSQYQIPAASSNSGYFGVASDSSGNLFAVGSNSLSSPVVQSFLVTSNSLPSSTVTSSLQVGSIPVWVTVSSNSGYVYVANYGSSTISEFSNSSGSLSTITTESSAPSNVAALGRDSTGSYLVALGYNSSTGLQPYTISSTGTLSAGTSLGTGTNTALTAAIAMSH